jgi:crotonobetainyl-CoA:carnitine CoA-transferase CaiB-like acyl-CoA transferase
MIGAFAVMTALWERQRSGQGQVIDISIFEPMFWLLGPQASIYDQLGIVQGRTGSSAPFTSPRNTYKSKDGRWLGMSASAQSIAERVMRIIGRPELVDEPWFADHTGRLEHDDELNELIGAWMAQHTTEEIVAAFEAAEGAIAPVMSIADIFEDPHYLARETVTTVEHPKLGPLKMQNTIPRFERTPGKIRTAGPELGADTASVLAELGYEAEDIDSLVAAGIIAAIPVETSSESR